MMWNRVTKKMENFPVAVTTFPRSISENTLSHDSQCHVNDNLQFSFTSFWVGKAPPTQSTRPLNCCTFWISNHLSSLRSDQPTVEANWSRRSSTEIGFNPTVGGASSRWKGAEEKVMFYQEPMEWMNALAQASLFFWQPSAALVQPAWHALPATPPLTNPLAKNGSVWLNRGSSLRWCSVHGQSKLFQ